MNKILKVENLSKTYRSGSRNLTVLWDVSFELQTGTTCAIVGPSGSGKTTLLGLCAGLDRSSSGNVFINGVDLSQLDEDQRATVRNQFVGFVFQNFQLIPTLTALENVMVPLELRGEKIVQKEAAGLLERVGLGERIDHYPVQLARAFINRPKILFADEPTGNLDEETSETITDLLFELNQAAGTTLVLVTHDLDLAGRTGRIIRLKGGRIISDQITTNRSDDENGKFRAKQQKTV